MDQEVEEAAEQKEEEEVIEHTAEKEEAEAWGLFGSLWSD